MFWWLPETTIVHCGAASCLLPGMPSHTRPRSQPGSVHFHFRNRSSVPSFSQKLEHRIGYTLEGTDTEQSGLGLDSCPGGKQERFALPCLKECPRTPWQQVDHHGRLVHDEA